MSRTRRTVLVAGATGLIGSALVRALVARGDHALATSRVSSDLNDAARMIRWNPKDALDPAELEGVDAIVNLAGEPIGGRWTAARKRSIRQSRVDATRHIVDAIRAAGTAPVLVNGSAIGYYAPGDETVTVSDPPGRDFLGSVCREWEKEAFAASELGCRVVALRTGLVLSRAGGVFPLMTLPVRLGLGGPLGSGRQWYSWIHLRDEIGLILHALDSDGIEGPLNAVSPEPATQKDVTRQTAALLRRPALLPTPEFVLRAVLGEASALLLDSHRVDAGNTGYDFAFPHLHGALENLLR